MTTQTPREVANIAAQIVTGLQISSMAKWQLKDRIESAITAAEQRGAAAERERWKAFADDIDALIDRLDRTERALPHPILGLAQLKQVRDSHRTALAAAGKGVGK